jgi:hypothetical protein
LLTLLSYAALCAGAMAGIGLGLAHPPIALATSTLLCVTLLYRSVTSLPRRTASTS